MKETKRLNSLCCRAEVGQLLFTFSAAAMFEHLHWVPWIACGREAAVDYLDFHQDIISARLPEHDLVRSCPGNLQDSVTVSAYRAL